MKMKTLLDKLMITADLTLITGMHIGASNEFAPIGAVDSVVVRDPLTRRPIIPGSSLKGKMRTLLARTETESSVMKEVKKDSLEICRLFGISEHEKYGTIPARLQFYDLFIKENNISKFDEKTDLYLTEIKFENTINRLDAVANPRQIERVPAGMEFELKIIYNLENLNDRLETEVVEDFRNITRSFKLLQLDYIGGNGTRGYGRLRLSNFKIKAININNDEKPYDTSKIGEILKEAENFALLSV